MTQDSKLVILRGITKKGKERIEQHGACWRMYDAVTSRGQLLQALNSDYLKWGPAPDFEVVE